MLVSQVPEWSCLPLGLCYSAIHQLRRCIRALLPQWGALSSQEWEIKAVSTALCWWISTPSTQTPAMAIFKDQGLCKTHEFLPVSAHSAWAGYCHSQLCSGPPRLPTGSCQGQHTPSPWALAPDGVQGTGSWGLDTAKTGRDAIQDWRLSASVVTCRAISHSDEHVRLNQVFQQGSWIPNPEVSPLHCSSATAEGDSAGRMFHGSCCMWKRQCWHNTNALCKGPSGSLSTTEQQEAAGRTLQKTHNFTCLHPV